MNFLCFHVLSSLCASFIPHDPLPRCTVSDGPPLLAGPPGLGDGAMGRRLARMGSVGTVVRRGRGGGCRWERERGCGSSDWAEVSSGPLANQRLSLAPSAPVRADQKVYLAPSAPPILRTTGASPPPPPAPRGLDSGAPQPRRGHIVNLNPEHTWNNG